MHTPISQPPASLAGDPPTIAEGVTHRKPGDGLPFFLGIAIAAAVFVFVGFARTYYLKLVFPTPTLPLLFHVHGSLFTAWILLLAVQAFLAASGRIALHQRVGGIGQFLVLPVFLSGCLVALAAARGEGPLSSAVRRGEMAWVPLGITPAAMLLNNLSAMIFFGVFAAAAVACRSRPEAHKRFIVLATIGLLPAAIGRAVITIFGVFHPALLFGSVAVLVLAMVIHDRWKGGRVHPVTLWGGLALMVSFPVRLALAKTDLWLSFAASLVR